MTELPAITPLRGLTVSVLRNAEHGDCSLGGISARYSRLTVVGILREKSGKSTFEPMPEDSRIFEAAEDRPAVVLVHRWIGRDTWNIRPYDPPFTRWFMMGGNFAHTSDSRFGRITGFYGAVAVHDRCEG